MCSNLELCGTFRAGGGVKVYFRGPGISAFCHTGRVQIARLHRGSCVGIVDLSPKLCAMGVMALKVSNSSCSHATPSASGRSGLCSPQGVCTVSASVSLLLQQASVCARVCVWVSWRGLYNVVVSVLGFLF